MQKPYKIRIKTGDTVMVRSGKYKGRTGRVLALYPKLNKAKVEGINVAKKHRKPTQQQPQGGIIDLTKPIWVSKLGVVDSTAKKPSRIGYAVAKDGSKTRVLKSSGKELK
jgi:large subunit ribosomal protein L24